MVECRGVKWDWVEVGVVVMGENGDNASQCGVEWGGRRRTGDVLLARNA